MCIGGIKSHGYHINHVRGSHPKILRVRGFCATWKCFHGYLLSIILNSLSLSLSRIKRSLLRILITGDDFTDNIFIEAISPILFDTINPLRIYFIKFMCRYVCIIDALSMKIYFFFNRMIKINITRRIIKKLNIRRVRK